VYKNMLAMLGKNKQIIFYVFALNLILLIPAALAPIFKQVFTDYVLGAGVMEWLPHLIILMLGIALLASCVTWMQKNCLLRLANKIEIVGTSQYIWRLLNSPLSLFSKTDSYLLISQANASARVSKLLTRDILTLLFNIVNVGFYLIMMLMLDRLMAGIVVVLVVVSFLMIKLKDFLVEKFSKEEKSASPFDLNLKSERISASGLEHIETFKSTASETFFYRQVIGSKIAVVNASNADDYEEAYTPLGELPEVIFFNLLLLISAFRIMDRNFTIGTYLAFQAYATAFFIPLSGVLNAGELFGKFEKRLKRLFGVLKAEAEQAPCTETPEQQEKLGFIEMKNVSFSYESTPVLQNISISLKAGQRLAVLGESGAGKTTLLKLLQGMYEPTEGEITIHGINPTKMDKALYAKSIGCANQEIAIFSASVRDNITLWDDSVSDAQIYNAASDACIHSHIANLDGAYDYLLAENGRNISGGQKQRIEMARAFLHNPAVVLLDEATGAIDPENCASIEKSLKERGCTCVNVTHVLSQLADYDEIIVLENGKITQRGTYKELSLGTR